jgi:hypothetical protein
VLGRPAIPGAAPVIIRPDDLVQEAVASEDGIEEDLYIMHLSIVKMDVQRTLFSKKTPRFAQPWLQESQVVVEAVRKKRGVFVGGVGGARFGAGEEGVEVAEGGVALRRVIERELLSYPELPPPWEYGLSLPDFPLGSSRRVFCVVFCIHPTFSQMQNTKNSFVVALITICHIPDLSLCQRLDNNNIHIIVR